MGPEAILSSGNSYFHAGRPDLEFTERSLSRARPQGFITSGGQAGRLPIPTTQDAYLDAILGFLVQALLMAL